jgi:hypothetical protein
MKLPLALTVITHEDFPERESYNNCIYSTFCKDIDDWLNRGINIPTFFYIILNIIFPLY